MLIVKIGIPADVLSRVVFRRGFESHSFAAFHALRKAFAAFEMAEMGHPVLVMVHPIHPLFGY